MRRTKDGQKTDIYIYIYISKNMISGFEPTSTAKCRCLSRFCHDLWFGLLFCSSRLARFAIRPTLVSGGWVGLGTLPGCSPGHEVSWALPCRQHRQLEVRCSTANYLISQTLTVPQPLLGGGVRGGFIGLGLLPAFQRHHTLNPTPSSLASIEGACEAITRPSPRLVEGESGWHGQLCQIPRQSTTA